MSTPLDKLLAEAEETLSGSTFGMLDSDISLILRMSKILKKVKEQLEQEGTVFARNLLVDVNRLAEGKRDE